MSPSREPRRLASGQGERRDGGAEVSAFDADGAGDDERSLTSRGQPLTRRASAGATDFPEVERDVTRLYLSQIGFSPLLIAA